MVLLSHVYIEMQNGADGLVKGVKGKRMITVSQNLFSPWNHDRILLLHYYSMKESVTVSENLCASFILGRKILFVHMCSINLLYCIASSTICKH